MSTIQVHTIHRIAADGQCEIYSRSSDWESRLTKLWKISFSFKIPGGVVTFEENVEEIGNGQKEILDTGMFTYYLRHKHKEGK